MGRGKSWRVWKKSNGGVGEKTKEKGERKGKRDQKKEVIN